MKGSLQSADMQFCHMFVKDDVFGLAKNHFHMHDVALLV